MGEQGAAPRGLPTQGRAERCGLHDQNHKVFLAAEVAAGGFAGLVDVREVDVPVGDIDRGAREGPGGLGCLPFRALQDLIDPRQLASP